MRNRRTSQGVAVVAAAALAVVVLAYRPLLFATFDPDVAEVAGEHVADADDVPTRSRSSSGRAVRSKCAK